MAIMQIIAKAPGSHIKPELRTYANPAIGE